MAVYAGSTKQHLQEEVPTLLGSYAWDTTYSPGEDVPVSGIYRCNGCGKEVASNKGEPFPPQDHHQHGLLAGQIAWQLVVKTNSN